MLIANLWIEVGLANGSLGQIKTIVYDTNSKPPELPKYVVVKYPHYSGPQWDIANQNRFLLHLLLEGVTHNSPLQWLGLSLFTNLKVSFWTKQ